MNGVKRETVDLSKYPDLVVVYLGMKVRTIRGLMTILGNVFSLGFAAWLLGQISLTFTASAIIHKGSMIYYILSGIVLLVGIFITVVGVHEIPLSPSGRPKSNTTFQWRQWTEKNWIAPGVITILSGSFSHASSSCWV